MTEIPREVHYADMSVSIVRPKCLENLDKGLLPQKWMGKKIASIKNTAGFDIDFEWQLPQLKYWIKNMDQIKTYQKKDSFHKLENKKM